jgi:sigma-E factor negative regulatory protein RseA
MQGSLRSGQAAVDAGERLSAAMDGEWEGHAGAAPAGLLSALSQQDRQAWSLYHLVGDALRSEDLAASPAASSRFVERLAARLETEPPLVAPVLARRRAQAGSRSAWAMGRRMVMVPSFAAAAAVATLAWVLVPSLHSGSGSIGGTGASTQVASLSADGDTQQSGSRDGWQRVNLGSDHRLDPYLEAHQQFASDRSSLGYAAAYAGLANDRR